MVNLGEIRNGMITVPEGNVKAALQWANNSKETPSPEPVERDYLVCMREVQVIEMEVRATSIEEAKDRASRGQGQIGETETVDSLDQDTWKVYVENDEGEWDEADETNS